ncbi:hypothetical protein ED733_001337 [Metarhizium rileyi]|uniref:Homeodomain-like protein n=1 Tax=Metarhizium rileyi (strain RCEF 4871) TaxID=1649241 RepID=A0A5C6G863_METRR|nr:hypothetical protein ED733_001337 [Metarhizium rileyi]
MPARSAQINVSTKAAILALHTESKYSILRMTELFQVSKRSTRRIIQEAIERGFDPTIRPLVIKDRFVQPKPRSGRPSKVKNKEYQDRVIKKQQRVANFRLYGYLDLEIFGILENKAHKET